MLWSSGLGGEENQRRKRLSKGVGSVNWALNKLASVVHFKSSQSVVSHSRGLVLEAILICQHFYQFIMCYSFLECPSGCGLCV